MSARLPAKLEALKAFLESTGADELGDWQLGRSAGPEKVHPPD
jgi:hypothetical protein